MRWPTLALAAGVGLHPAPGPAQAVPEVFPDGEIEVGLEVIGFSAAEILSVETIALDQLSGVEVRLAPRLDLLISALTRGYIGYPLEIFLCGRKVVDAVIREELVSATFIVTARNPNEAAEIFQFFDSPPCAAVS